MGKDNKKIENLNQCKNMYIKRYLKAFIANLCGNYLKKKTIGECDIPTKITFLRYTVQLSKLINIAYSKRHIK